MTVTVLNMYQLPNKQLPPGDSSYVYIGRPKGHAPLGLGNPFKVGDQYQRGEAVEAFRDYAREEWAKPNSELRRLVTELAHRVHQGEDLKLVCWCKPKSCHGDIIKAAIDTLVNRWEAQAKDQPATPASPPASAPRGRAP